MEPFIHTLKWRKGRLYIIDQTRLPAEEREIELCNVSDVWCAIRELKIRGAPAIGCVAAFGVVLAVEPDAEKPFLKIQEAIEYLRTSRPTAYNLFFALERMEKVALTLQGLPVKEVRRKLEEEALAIYNEDLQCCYSIGENGARLIKDGMSVLTHCNAGGLATSGFGTALAPLFAAKRNGVDFHVFVDETRPVLQGARLTSWELKKAGIPHTLICDSAAGFLMSRKKIDMVLTGADRIAGNGDTANKIGTYTLAVLAWRHGIDFYVAAPFSTFDPLIKTGGDIPVEERCPEEVVKINGKFISPEGVGVYNPAFDITPSELIKSFITENGIIKGYMPAKS